MIVNIEEAILGGSAIFGGIAAILKLVDKKKANGIKQIPVHCQDHSGLVECLSNIEKGQDRHEQWLGDISKDIKTLLTR